MAIWAAQGSTEKNWVDYEQLAPGSVQVLIQVDKWDYLKNPSHELKNSFCLGFLCIPRKAGRQNWRGPIFLRFDLIEQCDSVLVQYFVKQNLSLF